MLAYLVNGESQLADYAPIFLVENPGREYNRIGSPTLEISASGRRTVTIDPTLGQIFAERRSWRGKRGNYTNLLYRVHFREIPFSLFPFHLSAGKNVGLFVILTLNDAHQPVLITTLHACGCYLAFIPTSFLDPEAFPSHWDPTGQLVFGESLPGFLDYADSEAQYRLYIQLRDSVHRVTDLRLEPANADHDYQVKKAEIMPLASLARLQSVNNETFSFFETHGPRKDYVINGQKIWERLLISWWSLDWNVGQDKRLGQHNGDGPVFYTTLKPWARKASDLRDFATFLDYWGWKL